MKNSNSSQMKQLMNTVLQINENALDLMRESPNDTVPQADNQTLFIMNDTITCYIRMASYAYKKSVFNWCLIWAMFADHVWHVAPESQDTNGEFKMVLGLRSS